MGEALAPRTESELADLIASTAAPVAVRGRGSKEGLGRPVAASVTLDLGNFSGIIDYEPEELVLEAQAATPMDEIEALVAQRGQQLAFEPPDYSKVLGSPQKGSLGGILACNLSGPRRIRSGAARDHVLGIACVSGRGEFLRTGSRVVKNVTGYDLPKLLAGSHGTLAAMTAVTLKVLPRPETEETVVAEGLDDGAAISAMSRAMQSNCEVSAAAHLPGIGTFLRLEGIAASVAYRREALKRFVGGSLAVLGAEASMARWRMIRDLEPLASDVSRPLWRLSLVSSASPTAMARITSAIDARYFYDWAGGLVWLDVAPAIDGGAAVIRSAVSEGHATLFRAPEHIRAAVDVFQPQSPALAALSQRVKRAFDPRGILNPGRMYRDV
jgi:glycolate oxidase FAD binding subunit